MHKKLLVVINILLFGTLLQAMELPKKGIVESFKKSKRKKKNNSWTSFFSSQQNNSEDMQEYTSNFRMDHPEAVSLYVHALAKVVNSSLQNFLEIPIPMQDGTVEDFLIQKFNADKRAKLTMDEYNKRVSLSLSHIIFENDEYIDKAVKKLIRKRNLNGLHYSLIREQIVATLTNNIQREHQRFGMQRWPLLRCMIMSTNCCLIAFIGIKALMSKDGNTAIGVLAMATGMSGLSLTLWDIFFHVQQGFHLLKKMDYYKKLLFDYNVSLDSYVSKTDENVVYTITNENS